MLNVNISPDWYKILESEFNQKYFEDLVCFVKNAYRSGVVYPPAKYIFRAFDLCKFEDVKVVILGQDPYHGPNQANGLCFSVNDNVAIPPSLLNIFIEIKNDIGGTTLKNGNLENWAKQGVLLLNATLTVAAGKAGSHQNKGWERFTDHVIHSISINKSNVVFILWGNYAKSKEYLIDNNKHLVLTSAHPSPFSANKGFFGNKHFSKANHFLQKNNMNTITW